MLSLLSVPVILAGGYCYYKFNKKKVVEKALDMYASIVVYSKDKFNFTIDDMFSCNHVNLIHYYNGERKEEAIKSYFDDVEKHYKVINFEDILNQYEIKYDDHFRILFSYNYDNKDYFHYLNNYQILSLVNGDDEVDILNTYPIMDKNKFEMFKNNKLNDYFNEEEHINDSFYILLNGDLKHLETVKLFNKETEEYEVDTDNKLKDLFNKLKGPFNDWGLLSLNVIRNRWIFDDFNIDKKYKIIIKQGLYLNEDTFDLESDIIEIEYNEDFVKLPTLYKLFQKKLKNNSLKLKIN